MKRVFGNVDRFFAIAERAIGLLDRCCPRDFARETHSLANDFARGLRRTPTWSWPARPKLDDVRTVLGGIAEAFREGHPVERLYAARARELDLEARLVEVIGMPQMRVLAAERFGVDDAYLTRANALARRWARAIEEPSDTARSDDTRDPSSLISLLGDAIGHARVAARVEAVADLPAIAAVRDALVVVRAGVWLSRAQARRIALHEVQGHLLPRSRATREPLGLHRVGTAGAADDEEGRALVLEQREGFLDTSRRAELAWRHLAALAVRGGADFSETVDVCTRTGASVERAVWIAARVSRGGGLAREIVYLPAMLRVRAGLEGDPALENFMGRGRISLDAARVLRDLSERASAA